MIRFPLFLLVMVVPFLSYSQDYKQYIDLSYAEIDSLMYIEYNKGTFDRAIPLMQAGREKANGEFGEQDSVFAEYCGWGGFLYRQTGQYDKALLLSIQDRNIRENVLGIEHPSFAQSLNNLAQLHQAMGNPEKALPLFIQAKNIREKVLGIEHPDFAGSLNNLAHLHQEMGNLEKALPLFIQAKNIREKILGKEHPEFAQSLNNLALLHQAIGNPEKALPLYIQTKNILEKVLGVEHPYFALSLNNLAYLHRDMGNYEKALPLFIQAKNTWEKVLGVEHPRFALSLNNLAYLHRDMGNYEKALPLFIQAKNIREKVLGVEHPEFAQSLQNLAALYQDMGNREKAWTALLQAIEVSSSLKLSRNIRQPWADSLLQAPYSSNLHLEGIATSLTIVYELLGKDPSITASEKKQRVVADLAIQLLNKLLHQTSNEKDKLRILKQTSEWVDRSLKGLNTAEHSSKAFALADQNKSVLLLQSTKSEATYRLGNLPDSLVRQNKKMLKQQSELRAKLYEKRMKEEKDSLRYILIKVEQEIEDWGKMVKDKYPKYHKLKYQRVDAKVEEAQALLDEKTALLEYVITDSTLHIFRVDKQEVKWLEQAISSDELKKKIKGLHKVLSDYLLISKDAARSYREYTRLAHWFYQNLLEPVLKDASGIKNLIIVSDGELGHLPFETFLVEAASEEETAYSQLHYLLKDYTISYNYSATLWKENMEAAKPTNNGEILGMAANYNMALDTSIITDRIYSDTITRNYLSPLPAARAEVEALQAAFKGFFAFDSLANEKTIKKMAGDYAVIHLAMHGLLNNKRPVLSSLAFTEDSDSLENNFWQAHEISKMELNADLVVLSACETGYGKFEKGNGIASLARAFMYAGSSSLIVSLWQVNDKATSIIMQNLYNNLADGMRKDEALRHAKIQYIQSAKDAAAHPAFWSPFIQIGNADSMEIQRKGGSWFWWAVGGVSLVIIGGGLAMRRRKGKERVA